MCQSHLIISTRKEVIDAAGNDTFGSEPGCTRYLEVPNGESPKPTHEHERHEWVTEVRQRAATDTKIMGARGQRKEYVTGDVLVFVHGYNTSVDDLVESHERLQQGLQRAGFGGVVVSFDWPSADSPINYWEDRSDAQKTARALVDDGIRVLAMAQRDQDEAQCDIDVHILGHSTGAYVIQTAFQLACHDRSIARINWNVSQVAFIGGDIGRGELSANDPRSQGLFHHSTRITNYQDPWDAVLKLSNIKRLGLEPRVGRVGTPHDAPDSVVNVDVGRRWRSLQRPAGTGKFSWSHFWHLRDDIFLRDLSHTLAGDVDRNVIPTRCRGDAGLCLRVNGTQKKESQQ